MDLRCDLEATTSYVMVAKVVKQRLFIELGLLDDNMRDGDGETNRTGVGK
jgi:hypothetical protein